MKLNKIFSNKIVVATTLVAILLFTMLIIVYTVNSKQETTNIIRITQSELNQTIAQNRSFLEVNNQQVNKETIEQDARNQITNKLIVEDYAANNSISVDREEIQNYYQSRIEQYGDEAEFLKELNRLYSIEKPEYMEQVKYDILREKVQEHVGQPLSEWLAQQRDMFTLEIIE